RQARGRRRERPRSRQGPAFAHAAAYPRALRSRVPFAQPQTHPLRAGPRRARLGASHSLVRRSLLYAALPALLVVVLEWPALAGGKHFFLRDVLTFSWPEKIWTQGALRSGQIPLWDPRLMGGVPHLAYVTYGVLDPLNILLVLFPLPRALDLSIVAHVLLAALFSWGLARSAGLSRPASALVA